MSIDRIDLENQIRKVIAKISNTKEERISPDTKLVEELGVESIMVLEIMVNLDKKFGIEIPESEILNMTTLKKITEMVDKLKNAK